MQACTKLRENPYEVPLEKPHGGYSLIRGWLLCGAWKAFTLGLLRPYEVRVWLACFELVSRRFAAGAGSKRRLFTLKEVSDLVGGGGGQILCRKAIENLQRLGLITWTASTISFPKSKLELAEQLHAPLEEMMGLLENTERLVPAPRQIIRMLAGGVTRSTLGTTFAVMLRCLYRKNGLIHPGGSFKAGEIGAAFELSPRSVKRARKHLMELGWITAIPGEFIKLNEQLYRNRYGMRIAVNLDWKPGKSEDANEERSAPKHLPHLSPPPAPERGVLSPPESEQNLPTGLRTQNLGGSAPNPPLEVSKPKLKKPNLSKLIDEDLWSIERQLILFEQAVERGLLKPTEPDRRYLVAAAQRARVRGSRNKFGLFIWFLTAGRDKQRICHADEDLAALTIKEHLFAEGRGAAQTTKSKPLANLVQKLLTGGGGEVSAPPPRPRALSEDARYAEAVLHVMKAKRIRGDAFALVRKSRPDWSIERWKLAQRELEAFSLGRKQNQAHSACGV